MSPPFIKRSLPQYNFSSDSDSPPTPSPATRSKMANRQRICDQLLPADDHESDDEFAEQQQQQESHHSVDEHDLDLESDDEQQQQQQTSVPALSAQSAQPDIFTSPRKPHRALVDKELRDKGLVDVTIFTTDGQITCAGIKPYLVKMLKANNWQTRKVEFRQTAKKIKNIPTDGQIVSSTHNIAAIVCQSLGKPGDRVCTNCQAGDGPFTTCKVLENVAHGACANCQWSGGGHRCSLNPNNELNVTNKRHAPATPRTSKKMKLNACGKFKAMAKTIDKDTKTVKPPTREQLRCDKIPELEVLVHETTRIAEYFQSRLAHYKMIAAEDAIVFSDEE